LFCSSAFISSEKKVDFGWQLMSSYAAFRHLTLDDITQYTDEGNSKMNVWLMQWSEHYLQFVAKENSSRHLNP
jgi:hypothetical protein